MFWHNILQYRTSLSFTLPPHPDFLLPDTCTQMSGEVLLAWKSSDPGAGTVCGSMLQALIRFGAWKVYLYWLGLGNVLGLTARVVGIVLSLKLSVSQQAGHYWEFLNIWFASDKVANL